MKLRKIKKQTKQIIAVSICILILSIIASTIISLTSNKKKCLIVYYSNSGNTKRIAESLARIFKKNYKIKLLRIKHNDNNEQINTSKYDLIALGSPVYYKEFCLPLQTTIRNLQKLKNKKIILFVTYGSGLGRQNALNNQEKILKNKGAKSIQKLAYPGTNTRIERKKLDYNIFNLLQNKYTKNNQIIFMDTYPTNIIPISGTINYDNNIPKTPLAIAIWSQRAFKEKQPADIEVTDTFTDTFNLNIPIDFGPICLGLIDANSIILPTPSFCLNDLSKNSYNITNIPIKNIQLKTTFNKVFISGSVPEAKGFNITSSTYLADILKKTTIINYPFLKIEISVSRILPSGEIIEIVNSKALNNNILLKPNDHIRIMCQLWQIEEGYFTLRGDKREKISPEQFKKYIQ